MITRANWVFQVVITLIIISLPTYAQSPSSGSIEGRIVNTVGNLPLADVNIVLLDTDLGTASDATGYYHLDNLADGLYQLQISALGFLTTVQEVRIENGQTLSVHFEMFSTSQVLDEIVVMIGSKERTNEILGSSYFVSPKELEKFNYTDINSALRSVPGVNIQEEDGFGLRPNIGLRGTGVERSSKITVMEDGVLSAPAPYTAPAAYYFPTVGRMSAIEILKGSSQIKYGPFTTGGAINLVSTPLPNRFSGKIDLMAGSFGMRNLHANVGNRINNWSFLLETFQYGADGFKELDNGGDTGFYKQDYIGKLGWQSNIDARFYQNFVLKVGHSREESNETYLGLTREDFDENPVRRYAASQRDVITTEQMQYSLNHTIRFNDVFKVKTAVYRNNFSRNWYKLDKVIDDNGESVNISALLDNPAEFQDTYDVIVGGNSSPGALLLKNNNRSYYGQGIQSSFLYENTGPEFEHNLELGLRFHQDGIDRFQWVDGYTMQNGTLVLDAEGVPGTESNRLEDATAFAGFLSYEMNWNRFTFSPGLRYENILLTRDDYGKNDVDRTGIELSSRENKVSEWIPGASLSFELSEKSDVFFGVHEGFAPPGSQTDAKPEKSINYELGLRHNGSDLSLQAILFANDYSNLLGSDLAAAGGGGTQDVFDGGEVLTRGLEFQATYNLIPSSRKSKFSLPLTVAYTYTEGEFQSDFDSDFDGWGEVREGDALPYLANNQLSVLLSLEAPKWSVNLNSRYSDAMRTSPGQGEITQSESTDSYFLIDASADYQVQKHLRLFLRGTNLSDKTYVVSNRPAGLRPGLPRAFSFGIKASF